MPKDKILPPQASVMRALKDRVPTDQEIDMQNMDEAQDKFQAAQQAKIAEAEKLAQPSASNLWGFGQKAAAAPEVDLSQLTPDQLVAYFRKKNELQQKK